MRLDTEERTVQVYNAIIKYKQEHDGCSPTLQWFVDNTSYQSKSAVWSALNRLREMKLIRLPKRGRTRSIEVVGAKWLAPDDAYFFAYADIVDVLSVLETERQA